MQSLLEKIMEKLQRDGPLFIFEASGPQPAERDVAVRRGDGNAHRADKLGPTEQALLFRQQIGDVRLNFLAGTEPLSLSKGDSHLLYRAGKFSGEALNRRLQELSSLLAVGFAHAVDPAIEQSPGHKQQQGQTPKENQQQTHS
jgi:hypothetical protein